MSDASSLAADAGESRYRTILRLALPIMGGMASQNVMNLVDTAMVGSQGDAALAAVGLSSFANFMAQAFIMGLSVGVQAMAARRLGEGRHTETAIPLNGGLLLAVALGLPVSALLFILAPSFYPFLNDDPKVIAEGVPYLQARLCAIAAVGMNFSFRGYFNGVNLSKIYMRSLLVMHATNLTLNFLLIYGHLGFPQLGATGAGVGTAIATYVGSLTYIAMGFRYARTGGFLHGLPDKATLTTMLRLSVPSGISQLFFAAGLTTLFWIVGRVGTTELAAANVIINVMLVALLPGIGLGIAAASLVGQALGRQDVDDAARWGWEVSRVAVAVLAVLGLPMLLFPAPLLGIFIDDPATIQVGTWPLRAVGASIAIDGIAQVLQASMLGAGDSRRIMIVNIGLQWCLFLPIAYLVGPILGQGLLGVWLVQVGYRILHATLMASFWRRRAWAEIKV
ncbi:MAG: MATE family efflux transporter [Myxococcales bacterium]|nr:MATE family efflux transporter [Myxococcales bacterium]